MIASPNSLVPSVEFTDVVAGGVGGVLASTTEPVVFTLASAKPLAVRLAAGPQHGGLLLPTSHAPAVTQRRSVIVGLSVAPPSKSYTISMSPAVRCTRPSEPAGHAGGP